MLYPSAEVIMWQPADRAEDVCQKARLKAMSKLSRTMRSVDGRDLKRYIWRNGCPIANCAASSNSQNVWGEHTICGQRSNQLKHRVPRSAKD